MTRNQSTFARLRLQDTLGSDYCSVWLFGSLARGRELFDPAEG
jgi:predicted nucleotidyltransferase